MESVRLPIVAAVYDRRMKKTTGEAALLLLFAATPNASTVKDRRYNSAIRV